MERAFGKLKAEAERVDLPNECEENDRAVRYLALETGVGHYDDLNLLVMAVLIIFISVSFLAVNGGKIDRNDEEFGFSMESFLSGEFTRELEERYIAALPIPEEIKAAEERVSLLYGFGNTVTERKKNSYETSGNSGGSAGEFNIFDPDDDNGLSENAVTTKPVQTDKDGNTVTAEDNGATAPGGGTTAVARPASTMSTTTTFEDEDEDMTTTNNDPPDVTTTTTVITNRTETSETSDTEPPTDTEPTDTEPPVTEPSDTEPSDTEPPVSEEPAE